MHSSPFTDVQRCNSYSGGHEEVVSHFTLNTHFTSSSPLFSLIVYLQCIPSFSRFYSYPLNDAAETVSEIGSSIRRVMGGTSGIM